MELTLAQTIIAILIPIIGVAISLAGLASWSRQKKYESAKRMLILSEDIEGVFGNFRSPFMYSSESDGRDKSNDETPEETRDLNFVYAYTQRLEPVRNFCKELRKAAIETKIDTGVDVNEIISPLFEIYQQYHMSIRSWSVKSEQNRDLHENKPEFYMPADTGNSDEEHSKIHERALQRWLLRLREWQVKFASAYIDKRKEDTVLMGLGIESDDINQSIKKTVRKLNNKLRRYTGMRKWYDIFIFWR